MYPPSCTGLVCQTRLCLSVSFIVTILPVGDFSQCVPLSAPSLVCVKLYFLWNFHCNHSPLVWNLLSHTVQGFSDHILPVTLMEESLLALPGHLVTLFFTQPWWGTPWARRKTGGVGWLSSCDPPFLISLFSLSSHALFAFSTPPFEGDAIFALSHPSRALPFPRQLFEWK